jgi:glycosyltransferase involved in cell wall biosynthesis
MLISLVVPVYNVEKYLERCIDSLLKQDVPKSDYEIILVNDGSKDGSGEMAENFSRIYENVSCISQENKGLSGARNTGLRHAKGKFVWYIDSDDSIEPNVLQGLIHFMETQNLDIAHIGFTHFFNDGTKTTYLPPVHRTGQAVSGQEFFCDVQTVPTAWSFVHKRQHLMDQKLLFFEGIIHEDEEFLPRVMYNAQKVASYPHLLYAYFQNAASIMGTKNLKSDLHKCIVLKNFQHFLEEKKCSGKFENQVRFRAFILFQTMLLPGNFLKHSPSDQELILSNLKNSFFYPITFIGPFQLKFFLYKVLMNIDLGLYTSLRKFLK